MAIDWALIRSGCPQCGNELQWHSLTAWCLHCNWGMNWDEWVKEKKKLHDGLHY